MADTYANLVRFTLSAAPGASGDFEIAAAVAKFKRLGSAHDGLTFTVKAEQGSAWEIRKGCAYDHGSGTLGRGTLEESSTGAAIALTSATVVSVIISTEQLLRITMPDAPSAQTVLAMGDSLQKNSATIIDGIPYFNQAQASGLNWCCALLKQDMWLPYGASAGSSTADIVNYMLAVSGSTTEEAIDTQLPVARNLNAGFWSIQTGTNDLALLPSHTAEQICNRLRFLCGEALRNGARPILGIIPPRNHAQWLEREGDILAAGSTVAAQKAKHMAVNQWLRRYAQETRGVILSDSYNELVDPASSTGDWRPGMSDDGTHWSNGGGFVAGYGMFKAVRPFVKSIGAGGIAQTDVYSAANPGGNLATAAGFQGSITVPTATGMSGTCPTGWAVNMQDGTATAVCTVQARTDYVGPGMLANGRELQIAVSTAGANSRLRAYGPTMSNLVPANTPFFCEMEVSVSANSAAWEGPALQCFFSSPGGVSPQWGSRGLGTLPVGATFDAVLRTPIAKSTVAAGQYLFAQMLLVASSAATMKIRRMGVYPLLANQPGLLLGSA